MHSHDRATDPGASGAGGHAGTGPNTRRRRSVRGAQSAGPGASPVLALPMPGFEPRVQIGEDRAPERATFVSLEGFDGPLGLLLSLIEARQLDVLTVPLGALAGAYLEALAGLSVERLGHVSAFIAVASQLILIKSRALLPRPPVVSSEANLTDEAPDPEAELRARIILYRAHRDAGRRLVDSAIGRPLFRREPSVALAAARAGARPLPAPRLDVAILGHALTGLVRMVPPAPPAPETLRRIIRISDRAAIIRAALEGVDAIVLQELLA
ncbi:MAG TPA: segregation/condensation protein A, partial [Candidatus Saccharimonadales bacterium]|nr:segregation/condensation protein A [Candidatus Saccharimonadales bacterium]